MDSIIAEIMYAVQKLNNYGVLDLISIVLSPMISLLILLVTLRHDKKQFTKQIENQQIEHQENIKEMKAQHKEALDKQSEINRIAAMPYLLINKDIKIRTEGEDVYFEIGFVNQGNGTGIELTLKYLEEPRDALAPLFKSTFAIYGCACPFDYETSVVNPMGKCCFEMYQKIVSDNKKKIDADRINFKVRFKDMCYNQYEQEFMILIGRYNTSGKLEVIRTETYTPMVICG